MIPVEDVGAGILPVAAGAPQAAATSGAQTGTTKTSATGIVVDRRSPSRWYNSMVVAVPFVTTLATGRAVTLGQIVKHCSTSNGTFTTLASGETTVSRVGLSALAATRFVARLSVNLKGAKRFIRLNQTRVFNATASGAAGGAVTVEAPIFIMGGGTEQPAA